VRKCGTPRLEPVLPHCRILPASGMSPGSRMGILSPPVAMASHGTSSNALCLCMTVSDTLFFVWLSERSIWTRDASKRNADLATALDASLAAQVAAQGAQPSGGADGTYAAAGLPPGVKLEPRSALTKPGARDGVTIVVEEDGGCNAYTWDASGRTWECVGQVVAPPAATGGVVSTSSNGADFTFDVDVADGAPPRKLRYSVGQNPYAVADSWLAEQGMPAGYREQIVTFLVQNTGGPTGAAAQALAAAGTVNADPFTGGGSYMPPAVPTAPPTVLHTSAATSQRAALQYVPVRTTVTFESMPAQEALAGKLRTFMAAHGGAFNDAHSASLDAVLAYAVSAASSATAQPPASTAPLLAALLAWPADQLFPVFDLMRLLVLTAPGANTCGAPDVLAALPSALQRVGSQSPDAPGAAAGHVTALRLCCNACSHPGPLRQWMTRSVDSLLEWFSASPACASKPVRSAFGSLLLNLALHVTQQPVDGDEETKLVLLSAAVAAAASTPADDDDALFRALVALGTLCHTSSGLATTACELGARDVATAAVQRGGGGKAPGAAQDVMSILGR
jgi:phospholipase A-2-activating protein